MTSFAMVVDAEVGGLLARAQHELETTTPDIDFDGIEPLTNPLIWQVLAEMGLTTAQWASLVGALPQKVHADVLGLGHFLSIEKRAAPVAMVLRGDDKPMGRVQMLTPPSHADVDVQLGSSGQPTPEIIEAYHRHRRVTDERVQAYGGPPPYYELLLWDGAAYVRDQCQWGNNEIRQAKLSSYTERMLRRRIYLQRLGSCSCFVPL